jgi:hypothetical protein
MSNDDQNSSIALNELIEIDLHSNAENINADACELFENTSSQHLSEIPSSRQTVAASDNLDLNVQNPCSDVNESNGGNEKENDCNTSPNMKKSLHFGDGSLTAAMTRMAFSLERALWNCGPCHNYQRKQVEFEELDKPDTMLPLDVQLYQHYFSDD